jgi:hypothetical protein
VHLGSSGPGWSPVQVPVGSAAERSVVRGTCQRALDRDPTVAWQVLLKLMVDSATPASGRIRAALGIFGIAQEGLNMEMETRVAALERAAELAKSSGK